MSGTASDAPLLEEAAPPPSQRQSMLSVHTVYSLVKFFNDEALVMMAAAVWGDIVPIWAPEADALLYIKLSVALGAVGVCGGLQVVLDMIWSRWKAQKAQDRHQLLEETLVHLTGILTWQPRVCWAMLGNQLATDVQSTVQSAFDSPAVGFLSTFTLAYAGLRAISFGELWLQQAQEQKSVWRWPLRTLRFSALQMCAKICYTSWLTIASLIQKMHQDQVGGADLSAVQSGHAARHAWHSFWCLWLLLAVTSSWYSLLPELIARAEADKERRQEAFRLRTISWFICFVWASGFPDTAAAILVDYYGTSVLHNELSGIYLLYGFSAAIFGICSIAAVRKYRRGRIAALTLQPDERAGLVFKAGSAKGIVYLVGVRSGTAAERQQFRRFAGRRVLQINGQNVAHADHAQRLIEHDSVQNSADGSTRVAKIIFKGYQPVAEALSEAWGETTTAFVLNSVNNLFWWSVDRHITFMWAKQRNGGPRALCLAISLTAFSVILFMLNRGWWQRRLALTKGFYEGSFLWGLGSDMKSQTGKNLWKSTRAKIKTMANLRPFKNSKESEHSNQNSLHETTEQFAQAEMAEHDAHADEDPYFEHSGTWMPGERSLSKAVAEMPTEPFVLDKCVIVAGNDVVIGSDCEPLDSSSVTLLKGQRGRVVEVERAGRVAVNFAGSDSEHWCSPSQVLPVARVAVQEPLAMEMCMDEVRQCFQASDTTTSVAERPMAAWFQHLSHWAIFRQRQEALATTAPGGARNVSVVEA